MGRAPTNKKQALLTTAMELMWQNSYGSVSVDDICKASEVNKGSFYYYFKSKADLALTALATHFEEMKPLLNDIFSPTRPPTKRLEMIADHEYTYQKDLYDKYGRVCGCPFETLGSEMAGLEEGIRNQVEAIFASHLCYYENALNDMVKAGKLDQNTDTKKLAEQIQGFIVGQMTIARVRNSVEPVGEIMKEGIMRLVRGSRKE